MASSILCRTDRPLDIGYYQDKDENNKDVHSTLRVITRCGRKETRARAKRSSRGSFAS